jgi:hypothetical protein
MPRHDILSNSDGSPQIQRGDFSVGPSDLQHQEDILYAAPGHLINAPLLGVNLFEALKSGDTPAARQTLRRCIAEQLALDGYDDATIDLERLVAFAVQAAPVEPTN